MKHKLMSVQKYLIAFIVFISVASVGVDLVYSASVSDLLNETGTAALYDTSETATDPATLVGGIIKVFLSFLGVFFVGLTIYGGFLWMSARGDSEKAEKAKGIIRDALIGLIIAISAYAIAYFVLYSLSQYANKSASGF